eukprot:m.100173 g.100173  ORF g.100173 m.100173 type:complete len:73 (+) comp15615_c1_seq5:261-479(+)
MQGMKPLRPQTTIPTTISPHPTSSQSDTGSPDVTERRFRATFLRSGEGEGDAWLSSSELVTAGVTATAGPPP